MAQPLPALAIGDLFRAAGGYGSSKGLLESFLEREEAVAAVSSLDGRDQGIFGERCGRQAVILHLHQKAILTGLREIL